MARCERDLGCFTGGLLCVVDDTNTTGFIKSQSNTRMLKDLFVSSVERVSRETVRVMWTVSEHGGVRTVKKTGAREDL